MDIRQMDMVGAALSDDTRMAFAEADVIIAVDESSQREFTVFGTPSLESTVTIKRPSAMRIVRVSLDCRAGDLEKLTGMVQVIKGLKSARRPK